MFVPRSEYFSGMRSPTAPSKPMINPMTLFVCAFMLKKIIPIPSVKNGVSAFNIPVSEEEIPVSAAVKRKAGIKFPHKPMPRNLSQSFDSAFLTYLNENGITKRKAISIRSPAT